MVQEEFLLMPLATFGVVALLLATTRTLASQLYGIEPTDPVTLGAVLALLGTTALAACYLPARRAAGLDPVQSLRSD